MNIWYVGYILIEWFRSSSSTVKCQNCKVEHCDPDSNPRPHSCV